MEHSPVPPSVHYSHLSATISKQIESSKFFIFCDLANLRIRHKDKEEEKHLPMCIQALAELTNLIPFCARPPGRHPRDQTLQFLACLTDYAHNNSVLSKLLLRNQT